MSTMFAHLCEIAWKVPIGLPKATRVFEYSEANSSERWQSPSISTELAIAPSSVTWSCSPAAETTRPDAPSKLTS